MRKTSSIDLWPLYALTHMHPHTRTLYEHKHIHIYIHICKHTRNKRRGTLRMTKLIRCTPPTVWTMARGPTSQNHQLAGRTCLFSVVQIILASSACLGLAAAPPWILLLLVFGSCCPGAGLSSRIAFFPFCLQELLAFLFFRSSFYCSICEF